MLGIFYFLDHFLLFIKKQFHSILHCVFQLVNNFPFLLQFEKLKIVLAVLRRRWFFLLLFWWVHVYCLLTYNISWSVTCLDELFELDTTDWLQSLRLRLINGLVVVVSHSISGHSARQAAVRFKHIIILELSNATVLLTAHTRLLWIHNNNVFCWQVCIWQICVHVVRVGWLRWLVFVDVFLESYDIRQRRLVPIERGYLWATVCISHRFVAHVSCFEILVVNLKSRKMLIRIGARNALGALRRVHFAFVFELRGLVMVALVVV